MAQRQQYPGGILSYLAGVGPMPPLNPQNTALATLQAGLNSGIFDPAHPRYNEPIPQPELPALMLRVVIYEKPPSRRDTVEPSSIRINIDTERTTPRQFLDLIYHELRKEKDSVSLGWKSGDENKTAPWHHLRTEDDAHEFLDAGRKLVASLKCMGRSGRREREVVFLVAVLDQPSEASSTPAPPAPAPPSHETAYGRELDVVKQKLFCAVHGGRSRNRWCYVRQAPHPQAGEHIQLGLEEVTLWARKMHDGDCDEDCTTPPNCLNFDTIAQRNASRNAGYRGSKPSLPPINIHIGRDAPVVLGDHDGNHASASDHQPLVPTKRTRDPSDNEDSDLEIAPVPIHDILVQLDKRLGDLDYLRYESELRKRGLGYVETAFPFCKTPEWFGREVGMAAGAIGPFVAAVKKRYKQEVHAAKRARLADENTNGQV